MNVHTKVETLPAIPTRWLIVARVVWVLLSLVLLVFFIGGLPLRYSDLLQICTPPSCEALFLSAVEAEILTKLGLSLHTYAVFHLAIEVITAALLSALAAFIFWKKFTDVIGLVMTFLLVFQALMEVAVADDAFVTQFASLIPLHNILNLVSALPLILIFFVFPNGRFVPNWSKYVVLLLYLILALASVSDNYGILFKTLNNLIFMAFLLLGFFSQIYRYRFVSNALQKRQTKLAIFGLAAFLFSIINWILFFEIFRPDAGQARLFLYTFYYLLASIVLLFFPISLVIAILRDRLWNIDILIRRTLIYGLLSACLVALYSGSIILAQTLFRNITGQDSQIIIVLSTLAIAALFTPLRRGIQNLIDRRFYRQKYDAEKILNDFALRARDEVELQQLTTELLDVVKTTMQPSHISLWLKGDSK